MFLTRSKADNRPTTTKVDEPPVEYLCPISLSLMVDPVIAADGHTYERADIELWFQQKRKSPKTGNQLADLRLIPNIALRQLIDDYRAKNGLPVVDVPRSPPAASPAGAGGGYGYGGGGDGGARADVRFDFLRNAVGPSGMTAEEADLLGLVITAHQAQHFDELAKRLRAWPSSPPHTLVFISESMSFARNHGESRIRRELIAHIPDYVSRHTTMHGLHESTLALLAQCAEHDDCAACRKKAVEACYTLYKACPAVRRSMDLAAFFLRRLRAEDGGWGGGDSVARTLLAHVALTDKLTGVREARPEYEHYLNLLPRAGGPGAGPADGEGSGSPGARRGRELVLLAVQSMGCYESIPPRYARLICDILLHQVRHPLVATPPRTTPHESPLFAYPTCPSSLSLCVRWEGLGRAGRPTGVRHGLAGVCPQVGGRRGIPADTGRPRDGRPKRPRTHREMDGAGGDP